MKLSCLGKSYEVSHPMVETVGAEKVVTFLGRRSVVTRPYAARHSQPQEELTFLGRRYTR